MKKTLFTALLGLASLLVATTSQASLFWADTITNYPLGCITTNNTVGFSAPQWISHLPGTGLDALIQSNNFGNSGTAINGRHLSLFQSGTEYLHRWFDPATTNGYTTGNGTVLYASFFLTVNLLPSQGGTYFAHFMDDQFEFRGRVFVVANTNVFPFTTTVPGTFRIGVANAANDSAQGQGPTAIVPLDLVTNTDYQIVLRYDIDNGLATVWVNPSSEADTTSVAGPITDIGAITNALKAFAFRQRVNSGRQLIRNVMVGSSFADVVTNTPALPLIGLEPGNITNYSGNAGLLEVAASGMGLTYQWYQVTPGPVTNAVAGGTGPQLVFPDLEAINAGQYFCTINTASASTNTTLANVVVNSTPTAPGFTIQPASTAVSVGGNQTLNSSAFGTGPLSYQWNFNGNPIPNDGPNPFGLPGDNVTIAGSQSPTLVLTGVSTNESGLFSVTVTGGFGSATSTNATLTVNPVKQVSIAYLRSLENTSTWQAGNTADTFAITGVVTMYTNVTSGTTASYYIQDGTAGIDLFVTGDASFRPHLGDIVAATGTLSSFNNALEIAVNSQNPYQSYAIIGHTNLLPAPIVFDLAATNKIGNMETNLEGSLVMLTNVWLAGTNFTGNANTTLIVTNSRGYPFQVFFPSGVDRDVANNRIATRFIWSITGVMAQFLSGSQGTTSGYQIYVTSFGDILTNAPPAVTSTVARSGSQVTITWPATPYAIYTNSAGFTQTAGAYSYSVVAATDLTGPYLPVATGLTFNTTKGVYTDTSGLADRKFYKVVSP